MRIVVVVDTGDWVVGSDDGWNWVARRGCDTEIDGRNLDAALWHTVEELNRRSMVVLFWYCCRLLVECIEATANCQLWLCTLRRESLHISPE